MPRSRVRRNRKLDITIPEPKAAARGVHEFERAGCLPLNPTQILALSLYDSAPCGECQVRGVFNAEPGRASMLVLREGDGHRFVCPKCLGSQPGDIHCHFEIPED